MSYTLINKYTQDVLKQLPPNYIIRIYDRTHGYNCKSYQVEGNKFNENGGYEYNYLVYCLQFGDYYMHLFRSVNLKDTEDPNKILLEIRNSVNEYMDYENQLSQKLDKLFKFCEKEKSSIVNIFLKFDEDNYHKITFVNNIRSDRFIDNCEYETFANMTDGNCIVMDPIKGVHIFCDNKHKVEIINIAKEIIYDNQPNKSTIKTENFIEKITPYCEYLTLKKVPIWIFETNKMYDFPLNNTYIETGIMIRSTNIANEQKTMRYLFANKNVEKISVKYNGNHYDILFEDIKIRYPKVDNLFKGMKPVINGTRYAIKFIEYGIKSVNAEIL